MAQGEVISLREPILFGGKRDLGLLVSVGDETAPMFGDLVQVVGYYSRVLDELAGSVRSDID